MELFTNPKHRKYFDERLRRIGFEWDIANEGEPPLTVRLTPLDSRRRPLILTVKWFEELGFIGQLDREEDNEEIETFIFDESERFTKSCYEVWADWIVDAVHTAGASGC